MYDITNLDIFVVILKFDSNLPSMQMSDLKKNTQTLEEREACLNGLARFLTLWSREKLENDPDVPKVLSIPRAGVVSAVVNNNLSFWSRKW